MFETYVMARSPLKPSWWEYLNVVSPQHMTAEEKGKVHYYVLVEKSVSVEDLQAATELACGHKKRASDLWLSDSQTLAGLFKSLITAASVSASVVPTSKEAKKTHRLLEAMQTELQVMKTELLDMKMAILTEIKWNHRCNMRESVPQHENTTNNDNIAAAQTSTANEPSEPPPQQNATTVAETLSRARESGLPPEPDTQGFVFKFGSL